jgi:hypothetical protein
MVSCDGQVPVEHQENGYPISFEAAVEEFRGKGTYEECVALAKKKYQVPVVRANFETLTVGVFHINSVMGKSPERARCILYGFIAKCMARKADVIVGDANKLANRYYADQAYDDMANSSFQVSMRQALYYWNQGTPLSRRLSMEFVDATRLEDKESGDSHSRASQTDLDCMAGVVLGWGKSLPQIFDRQKMENDYMRDQVVDTISAFADGRDAQEVILTDNDGNAYRDDTGSKLPYDVTPRDYTVFVSEMAKYVHNRDLWLKDTDQDWHLPMRVKIRQAHFTGVRQRTAEGWERSRLREKKYRSARSQKPDVRDAPSRWGGYRGSK